MDGYWQNHQKERCSGCEACAAACPVDAIRMTADDEGFRYPQINADACIGCRRCEKVCPLAHPVAKHEGSPLVFGGYHRDASIREASTSGGAFTALMDAWCDENYVIFGAAAKGLDVYHTPIWDKAEAGALRKSKYCQSFLGDGQIYRQVRECLADGRKVLFSGTPCQIAGLLSFLGDKADTDRLLTIEVVCESVPSPLLIQKYAAAQEKKSGSGVTALDYRYKDGKRWDFEVMKVTFENGRSKKTDRWFHPFWSIWLGRLLNRPSCDACPFKRPERVADITLGDLWGVHLYCPELYGGNGGSSLIACGSDKGRAVLEKAKASLTGHELNFETALKYQSPMRTCAPANPRRGEFMEDLKRMTYPELCRKWYSRPSVKLLVSKYLWGSNRQVVFWWKLRHAWRPTDKRR